MAFKKNREMKVYETSGYNYKSSPQIRLQGKWLEDLGFEIGMSINIECIDGKLIITSAGEFVKRKW